MRLADLIVSAGAVAKKTQLWVSLRCVQVWWDGVFDRPPGAAERNYRFPADEEHREGEGLPAVKGLTPEQDIVGGV